ncbi:hypothetical protein [Nonomuraea sp. NPDC050783]|uniref:hypothetical protein n=1 Tax=Nonomuraea sp. NPDC050783 TaxID=3154634 RepID=UPI003465AC1C
MVLQPALIGDRWYLRGVTPTSGPVLLGRWRFQAGAHWVGFDDDFSEPFIMRAFFDPKAQRIVGERYRYAGYMQFLRLTYRGTPIPPEVFGGRLADREPYASTIDNFRFVDFMGPRDAIRSGVEAPLYAFNAWLSDTSLSEIPADYAVHPLPNGSLYVPDDPDSPACASIVSEVTPGLLTGADIAAFVEGRDPDQVVEVGPAEVRGREAYRIALDSLEDRLGPLAGLDESRVTARAIGPYVLLTLADEEEFGETLVVRGEPGRGGGVRVSVHVLSAYDLRDLEGRLGRRAMRRIDAYLRETGQGGVPSAQGRGTNGLRDDSFDVTALRGAAFDLANLDDITFVYTTLAYGVHPRQNSTSRRNEALSGIVWCAGYRWDEDSGRLLLKTVVEPQVAVIGQKDPLLHNFTNAIRLREHANAVVDPYEFTTATMRRQPFGGGEPVAFVTISGEPITS